MFGHVHVLITSESSAINSGIRIIVIESEVHNNEMCFNWNVK